MTPSSSKATTTFPEASLKREYTTFSNHRSMCPWKGEAHYYSVMVNGDLNPNAVWYYPEPRKRPGRSRAGSRSGRASRSPRVSARSACRPPLLLSLEVGEDAGLHPAIACGSASGGVIRALSASDRKIVLLSATSFFTNFSEAAFGFA
jgi:hypothetical protein